MPSIWLAHEDGVAVKSTSIVTAATHVLDDVAIAEHNGAPVAPMRIRESVAQCGTRATAARVSGERVRCPQVSWEVLGCHRKSGPAPAGLVPTA